MITERLGSRFFVASLTYLVPLVFFQCTGTGVLGTCGASVLSSVDLARENACASVTTRRPNMEGRVAWAQIDKPCLAVCLIVLVSETGGCENFRNFLPYMVVSLYCDLFWRVMKFLLVVFAIFATYLNTSEMQCLCFRRIRDIKSSQCH